MSNLDYSMNFTRALSSNQIGLTTTVKQQVEHIQGVIEHLKQSVDQQKKSQSELELQLKKLNDKVHKEFNEMLNETTSRSSQLTNAYRNENEKQGKQFEYLQLQGSVLGEEHRRLRETSVDVGGRCSSMQSRVGV